MMPASPSKLHQDAARNIVTKYLKVRPGENAIIESWDHTMPMASAMVDEIRRVGGRTLHIQEDEGPWWHAIDRKQAKLLGQSSAPEWAALRAADVFMHFWGPGDTDRIEKLPERTFEAALGWFAPWYPTARKTGLRGARVAIGFATAGRAKQWGLDRTEWENRMLRACLTDPVKMGEGGSRLYRALSHGSKVRITHSNGTDLEVALAGGAPRLHDGTPHPRNKRYGPSDMLSQIPGGRIDVALDSKSAEGTFQANRRTNIWWHWTAGGTFEFSDGKLRSYSFEEGGEEFARQYRRGTAGKDRTGSLTFGLNPAAHDVPNLETVERGSVTLVIGRNRHLDGGTNPTNYMDWVSLAGAEVSIDGTVVVRGGKLL
jgi:leucyl aminopeptidase (aminopeptidase T)